MGLRPSQHSSLWEREQQGALGGPPSTETDQLHRTLGTAVAMQEQVSPERALL